MKIDINQVNLTLWQGHWVLYKMTLGGTKDKHFSCFHSSCQLGLTCFLSQHVIFFHTIDICPSYVCIAIPTDFVKIWNKYIVQWMRLIIISNEKCKKKNLLNWSLAIINLAVGRASESPTALELLTANPYSCPASKSLKS